MLRSLDSAEEIAAAAIASASIAEVEEHSFDAAADHSHQEQKRVAEEDTIAAFLARKRQRELLLRQQILRTEEERGEDPEAPEPARELLIAHALSRGFMTTTKGSPDESRSARIIIKDLVNAKLLLCTPPPGEDALENAPGRHPVRRTPRAPTAARWLDKVQADYDQQKHTTVHMGGRKTTHESNKHLQWRPGGSSA